MDLKEPPRLSAHIERWPIAGTFSISRGSKTEAEVVVAEINHGGITGRGECVPYARYGESLQTTLSTILSVQQRITDGLDRRALQTALPAGAARNALDCALIDLESKRAGARAWEVLGRQRPQPCTTAYTISLGSADAMATAAAKAAHRPLLKIKLGSDDDVSRIVAVRRAAPRSQLIVDANEAWTDANLAVNIAACADAGVTLIEQPLPAGHDEALAAIHHRIAICADESVHDRASMSGLRERYDAVNIKLDKTGGLTEAVAMADAALAMGLDIMIGCMVGTSLAMAPAMLLAQQARYVDLDGPLLLAADRDHPLRYEGSTLYPPPPELWG